MGSGGMSIIPSSFCKCKICEEARQKGGRFLPPAAICFSHPLLFYCLKCLVKILNDIVNIFRSDGQADRIRPDSLI